VSTRFIGRDNVRKRLEPLEGTPGRTTYADGTVQIESESEQILVRPSFGLAHEGTYDTVHVGPLLEEIVRDHVVAAVLVRLGGYAVGVFDGERLVASKVGSRFVKNRHKKGGSSANRFRRRREEQARALVDEAAEVTERVLAPWKERAPFAALGGDRTAIDLVLTGRPELAWLRERSLARFFTVVEPRQRVLEQLPYDLYSVEVSPLAQH
jgi:Actinobacteria/chloroflexi VLRF1 release factor